MTEVTVLPYDGTPPPELAPPATQNGCQNGATTSDDPLDRPLDDYRPEVPDHVKSLIGRMGKGKVYLLEETPAILHVDGEERIQGDTVGSFRSLVHPVALSREASC